MKITPIKFNIAVKIFKAEGFVFSRIKGSHYIYEKEGNARPVIIPRHGKEVSPRIIETNLRAANISREKYFQLLRQIAKGARS